MTRGSVRCGNCGEPIPLTAASCQVCGWTVPIEPDVPALAPGGTRAPRRSPRKVCPICGGETTGGTIDLRVGGHSGKVAFFLGDVAEFGEEVSRFTTETCQSCGHVAFFR